MRWIASGRGSSSAPAVSAPSAFCSEGSRYAEAPESDASSSPENRSKASDPTTARTTPAMSAAVRFMRANQGTRATMLFVLSFIGSLQKILDVLATVFTNTKPVLRALLLTENLG